MPSAPIPSEIPNSVDGQERPALGNEWVEKYNPATGELLCRLARSREDDVQAAVHGAKATQRAWADTPGVKRGDVLNQIASTMRARREELARIVAVETGK